MPSIRDSILINRKLLKTRETTEAFCNFNQQPVFVGPHYIIYDAKNVELSDT